jgi:hypothetical protein
MRRVNSNKLSSAFLNRVIRVWLPALDAELLTEDVRQLHPKDVENTGAFYIISECLSAVAAFRSGRRRLTLMLLTFHAQIKRQLQLRALTLAAGVELTFRFMLNTYRAARARVTKAGDDPVKAFMWAMRRVYIDAIVEPEARALQLAQLRDLVFKIKGESESLTATTEGQQPEAALGAWMAELELVAFEVVSRAQREIFDMPSDSTSTGFLLLATVLVEEPMLLNLLQERGVPEGQVKEHVRAFESSLSSSNKIRELLKLLAVGEDEPGAELDADRIPTTDRTDKLRRNIMLALLGPQGLCERVTIVDAPARALQLRRLQRVCSTILKLLALTIWEPSDEDGNNASRGQQRTTPTMRGSLEELTACRLTYEAISAAAIKCASLLSLLYEPEPQQIYSLVRAARVNIYITPTARVR